MKTSVDSGVPREPRPRLPRGRTLHRAALGAFLAATGACSGLDVDPDRETRVLLVATPPAATVGETISFRVEAEGRELIGVEVAYGDGTADSLDAIRAQTAQGTFEHAYDAAAEYEAIATVFEISGRTLSDTVLVPVTDPGGG